METEWSELYHYAFNTYRAYQYTSLCKESTDILDFPPHSSHITIRNENKICNNLCKYIKIGAPFRISHGFLACNALPNEEDKESHINSIKKLYLLYGKIDQDGVIEGLAAYRFKSLLFEGSFKSIWNGNSSFHTVLQHDRTSSNKKEIHGLLTEWTLDNPDGNSYWIGTRLIYHFPRFDNIKFSTGGEAYYSISEKTGAASLGARAIFQDNIRFMTTWNPFMGHISGHCCVPSGQFLQFATRYDYNYYSYESDVSIGFMLQDPKSSDDIPNCRLGCRYTYNQGFAVQFIAKFTRYLSADLVISSNSRRNTPVIGLSLQFST